MELRFAFGVSYYSNGKANITNLSKKMEIGAPLRDSEIRAALRAKLHSIHSQDPETVVIDELSLCQGDARVDMAVVNGSLSGYEIKSDRDTLTRLPRQLAVYEV